MQASLLLLIGQTNYTPRTSLERTCRSNCVRSCMRVFVCDRMWMSVFVCEVEGQTERRVLENHWDWRWVGLRKGWRRVKRSGAGGQDWWSGRRRGWRREEGSSLGTVQGGEFSFWARTRRRGKAGCLRSESRIRWDVKTVSIMKSLLNCSPEVSLCTHCTTNTAFKILLLFVL